MGDMNKFEFAVTDYNRYIILFLREVGKNLPKLSLKIMNKINERIL